MDFHVDPVDVTAFGYAMSLLCASTRAASDYAEEHLTAAAGSTGVLWDSAQDTIEQAKAAVVAALSRQGELSAASANELRAAAQMYTAIDRKAAAALDATLPPR